ncbi:MAG: formylglycine-generating enzyme family protein [Acidobacteriia bacterium]|nr:formylglycine-generating enzyme family protein [Terriglobia bacterium]
MTTPARRARRSVPLRRLAEARAITDALWTLLRPGGIKERPIPERHRLIFYLGHLEAFDWNLMCRRALSVPSFHPSFDRLFEFGIDPEPGCLPQDAPEDWPGEAEVRRYNARARVAIDGLLDDVPSAVVEASLEHRLMHAETLAYAFHNLPFAAKIQVPAPRHAPGRDPAGAMIDIPAGEAVLGRERDDAFGWDNEFERHAVHVEAFRISRFKVTNGAYLRFAREGGAVPHFWMKHAGAWFYRGMFGAAPLRPNVPVYVTQAQATEYAAWVGKALPTEAQIGRASQGVVIGSGRSDVAFAGWDPVPVDACPSGDSAWGVSQLVGNGWEWTSTPFAPFPGFEPLPFYPGYSASFFDGRHYVLKGGSCRTAECLLRPSFRNWYRPDYPYVYAAFRLVEPAP